MNLENITFIDIETVPEKNKLEGPEDRTAIYWQKRFKDHLRLIVDETFQEHFDSNASFYAEFGKIVCITLGKFGKKKLKEEDQQMSSVFFVKSFTGNEKSILEGVTKSLEISGSTYLAAHNGKEFDFPFMFRRFLINRLPVPQILNSIGKKPWEVSLLDTMEMWSGTQWKHKVSLDLLCELLGVESPKNGITGDQIASIYYDDEVLPFDRNETIAKYCQGDVVALANVYCRITGNDLMVGVPIEILKNSE